MEEIEEKAAKLEIMEDDLGKTSRLYTTTQEKTRKEVSHVGCLFRIHSTSL